MKKIFLLIGIGFIFAQGFSQEAATAVQQTQIINAGAQKFNTLLEKTPGAQLVDIRTPREYQMGHIKGALNVNFYDPAFKENLEKLNLDKDKPVFIYCRSGNRSRRSLEIFKNAGFKTIVHLVYGINDWYRNGYPLTR